MPQRPERRHTKQNSPAAWRHTTPPMRLVGQDIRTRSVAQECQSRTPLARLLSTRVAIATARLPLPAPSSGMSLG